MTTQDVESLRQRYISPHDHEVQATAIRCVYAGPQAEPALPFERRVCRQDAFQDQAFRCYSAFRNSAQQQGHELPWSQVEHGFAVIGAGIEKCVLAYHRYTRTAGIAHDKEVLLTALGSAETIRFFTTIANMSGIENREYETLFNLKASISEDYGEFNFNPDRNSFTPTEWIMNEAEEEAACKRYELTSAGIAEEELGTCPAIHFIPAATRDVLALCDENGLFDDPSAKAEACSEEADG